MTEPVQRTDLTTILDTMTSETDDEGQAVYGASIPPDWKQGRAVYGGLTVALCVRAAALRFTDLPPLRSVLVTFIGPPASSSLQLCAQKIREGKSATFVEVHAESDGAPVARVSLVFGAGRPSQFSEQWHGAPEMPSVDACPPFFEMGGAPNFAQQFNSRFAGGRIPMMGAEIGDVAAWLQHKDEHARTTLEGLVCLADGLPPAAMTLMQGFAPVSSMTWMFDIVGDVQSSPDGWWLCRSTCESVGEGYSSQHMAIWNAAGEPVIIGRQNCVIFA